MSSQMGFSSHYEVSNQENNIHVYIPAKSSILVYIMSGLNELNFSYRQNNSKL